MISLSHCLAVLALLAFILYVILYNWRRRDLYLAASKISGPFALPIIGNATLFMCKNEDILMKIYNLTKDSNLEPMRIWLGPILLIAFLKPGHFEKILSSSKLANKHDVYDFVKIYLGEGLVSGSGPQYKQHRRIIQPLFSLTFAKESISVFQKHIDLCMNKLEKYVGMGTFNIHSNVHKCMVDIIKEIILGSDERAQLSGLNDFDQAMLDICDFGFTRIINPYLHPDIIFNMTSHKKRQDELQNILKAKAEDFIQASVIRRKQPKYENEFSPIIDRLMDLVESNPDVISDEILKDHIITLNAASEDTFTTISGFLTMCFGMYPEYQERAAKEIRVIFGDSPRPVTADDISKLNYVTMCIKDALRLFPIGPVILRKCTGNFQLDKYLIPKGCAVVVPIFTLHRDKRYWENPDHFHPDHFLPEIENKRHTFAYVPFSAGHRGCIGKILANTGLKVLVCNLLQRFEIEADGKIPDIELRMDISTRPKQGYFLRLKKRVWK